MKILFFVKLPPPVNGESLDNKRTLQLRVVEEKVTKKVVRLRLNLYQDKDILRFFLKIRDNLISVLTFFYHFFTFKPDAVYLCPSPEFPGYLRDCGLILIAKTFGKKIYLRPHSYGFSRGSEFKKLVLKKVFKDTYLLLLSRYLLDDIKFMDGGPNIRFFSHGLPDYQKKFQFSSKESSEEVKLLYLSNLIKSKGVLETVKAAHLLKQSELNFHLHIVGMERSISVNQLLGQLNELELRDHVTYEGPLYGRDKFEMYSASDLFIFPSYYQTETWGLVVLEALIFSLPIIATNVGSMPKMVKPGENGYLLSQSDPKEIAERARILISDRKKRERFGRRSREIYEENFTLNRVNEKLSSILFNQTTTS